MPRYEFARPARPLVLLQALLNAGLAADSFVLEDDSSPLSLPPQPGTTCWVTCDESLYATVAAVVAAHDAAALDAAEAAKVTGRVAAKALVLQAAQGAVGVRFDQLTAAQVRALMAIVLWQAGALDGNGVVQPLAGWVR